MLSSRAAMADRFGSERLDSYGMQSSWKMAGIERGAHGEGADVVVRARGRGRRAVDEEDEADARSSRAGVVDDGEDALGCSGSRFLL